jgi:Retron-type reverse transcriptase
MNAQLINVVYASPDSFDHWHSINWRKCYEKVRKMQARIVKATQEGRWRKVKSLQWLLTHSRSAKALAVKRVTENKGKKTPGVDGETWNTPEAKLNAVLSLKRCGYKPSPLKRVHIPKANGLLRPLGIPTMKDRAMQALYLSALEPLAETLADGHSYGFRLERSTADAGEQCFNALAKVRSPQWILEGDINGCFDNISHQWMLDHIQMDPVILQKWLKAGFVYQGKCFPTEAGTPQGGIASPTLANRVLDGLQTALRKKFYRTLRNGKICNPTVNLVRYADDFIITGQSKEILENEVKPLVEEFMAERGLMLSPEKPRITHIDEGFDFLGWNVRKYNGKLLIKPSKKNVQAFMDTIRETVKANPQAKQENLIKHLNPKIRGWTNYHKSSVAKATFSKVDSEVWQILWQWAKRRHPNKGGQWIKAKYFKAVGNRNWVFTAKESIANGKPIDVTLIKASDTAIRRHVKIKSTANPFDPKDEAYLKTV